MSSHARGGRHLVTAAGVLLAAAGLLAVTVGVRAQREAPQPPASPVPAAADEVPPGAAGPVGSTTGRAPGGVAPARAAPTRDAPGRVPTLAASAPTRLSIPAIGVTSQIRPLGLKPDRTVEVPPLGRDSYAGWYRYSPTPGQLGPSVILGHVDSEDYGPGVFFKLGALRPRDTVAITRADRTVAVFQVERVVRIPKARFPSTDVYDNTDRAALRLITCGGRYDPATGSYADNVVAYASLVSSHPA